MGSQQSAKWPTIGDNGDDVTVGVGVLVCVTVGVTVGVVVVVGVGVGDFVVTGVLVTVGVGVLVWVIVGVGVGVIVQGFTVIQLSQLEYVVPLVHTNDGNDPNWAIPVIVQQVKFITTVLPLLNVGGNITTPDFVPQHDWTLYGLFITLFVGVGVTVDVGVWVIVGVAVGELVTFGVGVGVVVGFGVDPIVDVGVGVGVLVGLTT